MIKRMKVNPKPIICDLGLVMIKPRARKFKYQCPCLFLEFSYQIKILKLFGGEPKGFQGFFCNSVSPPPSTDKVFELEIYEISPKIFD